MSSTQPAQRLGDILVVDDDDGIRLVLNDILTEEGYRVRLATNGSEALEQIAEREPALMFLDIVMPKVSGVEVLAQLTSAGQQFPVAVLTATPILAQDINFSTLVTLIHKPFDVITILDCVEQHVQRAP